MRSSTKVWSCLIAGALVTGLPGELIGLDNAVMAQTRREFVAEADRLIEQGTQQFHTSQFDGALRSWERALEIFRAIEHRQGQAVVLGNLGIVYESSGQYTQAIALYQQSLDIAQRIRERPTQVSALVNLGSVHSSIGQYEQAINYYQNSLELAQRIDNHQIEASALAGLGQIYRLIGQYQRAIEFIQQSLGIAQRIGDARLQSKSLDILGGIYSELGQYQQAIIYHQQSLSIVQELGDRQGEANSLNNLGVVYRFLGQNEQAISLFQQSLTIKQEIGDRQREGNTFSNLGNAAHSLGQYRQAIDYYQQFLTIVRELGDRRGEGIALNNLGLAFLSTERHSEAEQILLSAAQVWEGIRRDLVGSVDKVAIFDYQSITYSQLQEAQITQNKVTQALETAERGRVRTLAELLAGRSNSSAQNSSIAPPNLTQIQQIAQSRNITLVEYSVIHDGTKLENELGREAEIYIWVIAPTGSVTFRRVDLTPLWRDQNINLSELVQFTRESIGVRSARADASPELRPDIIAQRQAETDQKLRQLHQLLIDPIADLLPTDPASKVVFIPQESLFSVPFPALKDSQGQYLIEKHTILTAPSIQTFQLVRNSNSPASISKAPKALIVGNPVMPTVTLLTDEGEFENFQLGTLPGAQQEAQAVARFLKTSALIGSKATEDTVKDEIANADLIHFATHGLLEYGDPQQTGSRDVPGAIALASSRREDGLLTSSEILDMNLSADLVVLSACDTGRGRITGDGVIGLSRSFILAGVPSIIVSLWQVPDAPTAELMTEFYRQRAQTGDNAQALRQAMLSTMQTHPDPKNWAAFTLIGESQ